ncbi:metal-sensitive transcriptional regulator [Georgenia sp. Z1344]|uniref:metal-sensitive transcriptional regulator n=1 Tax=Georgenia sp. Z1344 TaxID=3416706 RepID=UPI003CF1F4FB
MTTTDIDPPVGAEPGAATASTGASTDSVESDPAHHHGYINDKARYVARLRKIEGQARGLQRMVDEEKYCIDILTQITALTSALRNVGLGLLDDHMRHCVRDAVIAGDEEADAKFKEVADAIARFSR